MASLPPARGRRRNSVLESEQPKSRPALTSPLPSWCSGFRKESLDSDRAYNERVTTSTKTSEIRLRQESVRYWNRFLEEAQAAAFAKIVRPTCRQINDVLSGDFGDDCEVSGETHKQQQEEPGVRNNGDGEEDEGTKKSTEIDSRKEGPNYRDSIAKSENDSDDDWEYCQQLFGLPSASATKSSSTPIMTSQPDKTDSTSAASAKLAPPNPPLHRVNYPLEVLPIFVITSPLISNCLQDRSKICHSMWRQLNGLEGNTGTPRSTSSRACCGNSDDSSGEATGDDRTICLYLPRLMSSLTESLLVIWDGLLSHYENTHDAPSMDPDDPSYYSNPNKLASKRHSYHVSKRKHYETILDRKITTESQKTKIGTKKQQSLQDFILEFLRHVYEEPKEFLAQERFERRFEQEANGSATLETKTKDETGKTKTNRPRRGNLIVLLEDPRILHPKVATAEGQGPASGPSAKPNNSKIVQSQLLETLAAWRGVHGIPVSLVVFHSVGSKIEMQQNNILLNPSFESSANGCTFGIRTVRCTIPSSSSIGSNIPPCMAFGVWCHYFLQATMDIPMPLFAPQRRYGRNSNNDTATATEIFMQMCRDALQNESSCTTLVSSIRARLATNFYTRKGSFVWDALNPKTANMMRSPSFMSEADVASGGDLATDGINKSNGSRGVDKDQQSFAIGNDDVHIFQPEFVAWFCSYHKALALLSSQAGDFKAEMTPSDKCEALLKCYRLLRPHTVIEQQKSRSEKPPKRRKLSKQNFCARPDNGAGNLQFWWSISCSLLPLYFLSLTISNEGMIVLSDNAVAPNRTTARGRNKKQNDRLSLEGEYIWILERLADVYKQTSTILEDGDHCDEKDTSESAAPIAVANKIRDTTGIKRVELGTDMNSDGNTKDIVRTESVGDSSHSNHASNHDVERNPDVVESILRRYLQRGTQLDGSNIAAIGDTAAIENIHRRSIRQLLTMVQELIVLATVFSTDQKNLSTTAGNVEDDHLRDYKIRLGMTEAISEINRLALGQVEAWTRRWLEMNPLMASSEDEIFRDDVEENYTSYPPSNDFGNNNDLEGRPVNLRRRILDNLPAGSRQLYEVLEGRLSVDRDDWFNSFGGNVEDFAVGVWNLRKCGLIRPKKKQTIAATAALKHERFKSRKPQEVMSYEKVAVVWC